MIDGSPRLMWNFSWLWGLSSWLSNSDSTVSTFSSTCAMRLPLPRRLSTVLNFISSLLMLFLVQPLFINSVITRSLQGQFFPECHPRVWFSFAEVSAGHVLWCRCTAEIHVLNDKYTHQCHLTMHINWRDNSSVAVNLYIFADRLLIKILSSLLSGVNVAAFAWYSVKIRSIFGVRFERQKVDKKVNLHENWTMQTLF